MPDELRPEWIDTAEAVSRVADACASAGRIALDTEADSLHSYFHKVCLIQVSVDDRHFVIDPLALDSDHLAPLWETVADPSVAVVMHGADYDVRVLDRDYGTRVTGLEDTQIMAQLLGEPKTGLGAILGLEFDLELDKRHQRADWGRRPLSPELLAYAAADTASLIRLASRLRSRLEEVGRWPWAEEEFRKLERVRFEAPAPDPLAFERVKGARALRGAARDRLYDLHQWRDREAQRRDLPPFKVLGNRPMLELAIDPPQDFDALAKVSGLGARFVRRWGREVLRRLQSPRSAPSRQSRPREQQPSATVRHRMKRLTEVRDAVAAELGLQPGLVCPRATVEEVAAAGTSRASLERSGLTGWRLEVLGDRFVEALDEAP
jgi:ribonuclease D